MKKYNLDLLKEQCGNDKAFFNEMIDIFIRSSFEGIRKMEEIYLTGDLKMLGHYAHKILSPCKLLQAEQISILLKEMETKSENDELSSERADFLIQKIKTEATELMKDLKQEYL
jgi:HPt (histidine-containing phosphotransfer) domain-containing protein